MKNFFLIFSLSLSLIAASPFAGLSINTSVFSQQKSPTEMQIDKIKKAVQEIGVGQDVTVFLKNGREYYGYIKNIDQDRFQVSEIDLKVVVDVNFSEVKKVKKGFGSSVNNQGKRRSPYQGLIVGAVIFGVLFTVIGVALANDR